MMIRRVKIRRMPSLKAAGEKQVQLHMHMRTTLVNAAASVTENAQRRACFYLLPGADQGGGQMRIEREVRTAAPLMPHHDVASVIAQAGGGCGIHHHAIGDRAYCVLRIAFGIALQRFDVQALVKACIDDAAADTARVTYKAELPALPGCGRGPVEVTVHELEELRGRVKQRVVGGGQLQLLRRQDAGEQAE